MNLLFPYLEIVNTTPSARIIDSTIHKIQNDQS